MSEKRIFYITANQLAVYWSTGKGLHRDINFMVGTQGYAQFAEYLQQYSDIRSYVLVDVIEEEFRIDTMPHVMGRDRLAIQERKLNKLFHQTRYRGMEIQGRETTGRRDDKVLFTALTNSEQLEQWLHIMIDHKTPVVGVYSLPTLAQFFLKKLSIKSEYSLLFVPQHGGMIRQIFLSNFSMKISRLLPIKNHDTGDYSDFLVKEAHKNQRYLHRLRLLSPGDVMDVYILCEHSSVTELGATCPNSDTIRYHFISVNEAMQHLELQDTLSTDQSEHIFIHLLSQYRPTINYADSNERRYNLLYQTRKALVAASVILTFAFIALAGQTFLNGLELKQKTIDLRQQAHITTDKYNVVVGRLPKTDISPRNMQNVVQIVAALSKHKTNPQIMLATLSSGLSHFPNMQINEIKWLSSSQPNALGGSRTDSLEPEYPTGVSLQNRYQIASIKGQLKSFNGNYQTAFRTVNKFISALRNDPRFIEVTATKYPLDIDSASTLNMTSGKSAEYRAAAFEIRAVIKVYNEKA